MTVASSRAEDEGSEAAEVVTRGSGAAGDGPKRYLYRRLGKLVALATGSHFYRDRANAAEPHPQRRHRAADPSPLHADRGPAAARETAAPACRHARRPA